MTAGRCDQSRIWISQTLSLSLSVCLSVSLSLSLSLSLRSSLRNQRHARVSAFSSRWSFRPNRPHVVSHSIPYLNLSLHATTHIILRTLYLWQRTLQLYNKMIYSLNISCNFCVYSIKFARAVEYIIVNVSWIVLHCLARGNIKP